ncbi:MAG: DUF1801 domain-containing protein [Planctomycetaceae bacterium]
MSESNSKEPKQDIRHGSQAQPTAKSRRATRATPVEKRAKSRKSSSPTTKATGKSSGEGRLERATGDDASRRIDERIIELGDWRGETLARMRQLILEAIPDLTEEWKWMGTPVWSLHGNICTGETYAKVVKLTFAKGASLPDPSHLFNASLDGNTRRAIDIREGEKINAAAFKRLVKAAVTLNRAKTDRGQSAMPGSKPKSAVNLTESKASKPPAKSKATEKTGVVLLSGGNPQIAKADGDAPVQAYIAAMPGWKRELGKRLDSIIVRTVPNVCKAVKWNSPFYGIPGQGWFLSFHVFTHYVKVTFFREPCYNPYLVEERVKRLAGSTFVKRTNWMRLN